MNTALLLVDLQNDFFPGGALPAPDGDAIVAPVNQLIEVFQQGELPIFATRDWHPRNHCSFEARGGPWPPHCIQGTPGADFNPRVNLPANATVISKAQSPERDAYSGFDGTDLAWRLEALDVSDVVVGGLVTEICVKNTVVDALKRRFGVTVVREAVSGVDVHPGDSKKALEAMEEKGARIVSIDEAVLQLA
ncbi:MAG: isochorismatase family protein [bacterium]